MKMESGFRLIYERIQQMLISFSEDKVKVTCCVTIQQMLLNREFGMKFILFEGKSMGDRKRSQVY